MDDSIPETPFCGLLRSKRMLMVDVIPTSAEQFMDPSGHCWCDRTHKAIGPDGFYADPDECRPGRACYRSALAPDGPEDGSGGSTADRPPSAGPRPA